MKRKITGLLFFMLCGTALMAQETPKLAPYSTETGTKEKNQAESPVLAPYSTHNNTGQQETPAQTETPVLAPTGVNNNTNNKTNEGPRK